MDFPSYVKPATKPNAYTPEDATAVFKKKAWPTRDLSKIRITQMLTLGNKILRIDASFLAVSTNTNHSQEQP